MKPKPIQFPNHEVSEFPYSGTSMAKHTQFPGSALPYRFRVNGNPCNHQCLGMCKVPCHGNILWKAISFLGCGLVKKLELIWKTKQSPEHESSKMSCYGNNKGKTTLFPSYGL